MLKNTVRLQLRFQRLIRIIFKFDLIRAALFVPLLLAISNSQVAKSEITIAILDTGFCSNTFKKESPIKILEPIVTAGAFKVDCHSLTTSQIKASKRFHGQRVLEEFVSHISSKEKIIVTPIILFDEKGEQSLNAWRGAIEYLEKNPVDYIFSASGFKIDQKIDVKLPSIWFLASGQIGLGIKKNDQLFPQLLHSQGNIFLIGSFFQGETGPIYNPNLLYEKEIDYYFLDGEGDLKGSSRAVAIALARAINLCGKKNIFELKNCLAINAKNIEDKISKIRMKTY